MYVGVAWVYPLLIALEGEYIRLTLIIMMVCKIDPLYIKVTLNTGEPAYIRLTLIV